MAFDDTTIESTASTTFLSKEGAWMWSLQTFIKIVTNSRTSEAAVSTTPNISWFYSNLSCIIFQNKALPVHCREDLGVVWFVVGCDDAVPNQKIGDHQNHRGAQTIAVTHFVF